MEIYRNMETLTEIWKKQQLNYGNCRNIKIYENAEFNSALLSSVTQLGGYIFLCISATS